MQIQSWDGTLDGDGNPNLTWMPQTDGDTSNYTPTLYNGKIAWFTIEAHPPSGTSLFRIKYWDGTRDADGNPDYKQVTPDDMYGLFPSLYNDQIAWFGWRTGGGNLLRNHIYFWDGTLNDSGMADIKQITQNDRAMSYVSLYKGQIAWAANDEDGSNTIPRNIFFWDGAFGPSDNTRVIQIDDDSDRKQRCTLYSGRIVWSEWDGHDYEIFYWNGMEDADGSPGVRQLTNNEVDDVKPVFHKGKVAFVRPTPGNDYEIWLGSLYPPMPEGPVVDFMRRELGDDILNHPRLRDLMGR
jgi:hypothetical protein